MIEVLPKSGPDSKYRPEYCQAIIDVAKEGGHISAMRLKIGGICKDTWYRWAEKYPEFKEAVQYADLVSRVFYEKLGLAGAMGQVKDFNATTYALIMNNKFKDEYSRGTGSNTEVTINNNTLNLTSEEIQQQIAQKLEKLQSLGVDLVNVGKQ